MQKKDDRTEIAREQAAMAAGETNEVGRVGREQKQAVEDLEQKAPAKKSSSEEESGEKQEAKPKPGSGNEEP